MLLVAGFLACVDQISCFSPLFPQCPFEIHYADVYAELHLRTHWSMCRKNEEPLVNLQKAIGKHEVKKRRGGGDSDDEDGGEGGSKRKKGRVGRVKNRRVPKKPKQTGLGAQKGKASAGKKGPGGKGKGKAPKPKKG